MGELYPGGPVELPCRVSVAGTIITAQRIPAVRIAYYCATGKWGNLAGALFDTESLADRLADPDDSLDDRDLAKAALLLAIRLSGAGTGIAAWRVLMHMCGVIISEWLDIAGRLSVAGVDPQEAQLWRVVATVRHLITAESTPEHRNWVERVLEYPLPAEPAWVPGAGSMDTVRRRAAAAFAEIHKEL